MDCQPGFGEVSKERAVGLNERLRFVLFHPMGIAPDLNFLNLMLMKVSA